MIRAHPAHKIIDAEDIFILQARVDGYKRRINPLPLQKIDLFPVAPAHVVIIRPALAVPVPPVKIAGVKHTDAVAFNEKCNALIV